MAEENNSLINPIKNHFWVETDQPLPLFGLYLCIALAFFAGFSLSVGYVLLLIVVLIKKENRTNLVKNFKNPFFILLTSFFAIQLLGLLYSEDLEQGLIKTEIKLPFLIFTISLFSIPKSFWDKTKDVISNFYLLSAASATLLCYGNATIKSLINGSLYVINSETGEKAISYFAYTELAGILMHPGYLTLYISVAILLLFWKLMKGGSSATIWISIAYFLVFVFLLQGRGSMLALFLVLISGFIIYIVRNQSLKKLSYLLIPVFLFAAFIWFAPENLTKRFTALTNLEYDITKPEKSDFNGVTIRFAEWTGAIHVIKKYPIIGTGTGDWKNELMKGYEEVGFQLGIKEQFNCHNQFLESQLSHGIAGPLILLFILIYTSYYTIKTKRYLLLGIIWMLNIGMLTESILDRQWGIFLFVFFIGFLSQSSVYVYEKKAIKETEE